MSIGRTLTFGHYWQHTADIPKHWPDTAMWDVSIAEFRGEYYLAHPDYPPHRFVDGAWQEVRLNLITNEPIFRQKKGQS